MSGDTYQVFNAAAVQASPVFLDRDATVEKACRLIEQAAERGSDLVVFPEVFIPAYPLWSFLYPPMETHGFFHRLFQNAVRVPSPQTEKLGETAFHEKVRRGSPMMPGFEHTLRPAQIDQLLAFLKTFTPGAQAVGPE